MTLETLLPWLIFISVFCFVSAVAWAVASQGRTPDSRVDELKKTLSAARLNSAERRKKLIEQTTTTLSATLRPRSEAELVGL